jgi:hypothetical protein
MHSFIHSFSYAAPRADTTHPTSVGTFWSPQRPVGTVPGMIDPGLASLRCLKNVLLYELWGHIAGLLAAGQRLNILLHINLADRTIYIRSGFPVSLIRIRIWIRRIHMSLDLTSIIKQK